MNAPFDTALLKHLPDHLSPLTEAERAAEKLSRANRQTFRKFVAQVFAFSPRLREAELPRLAATTRL
jgi:hypothetical protein